MLNTFHPPQKLHLPLEGEFPRTTAIALKAARNKITTLYIQIVAEFFTYSCQKMMIAFQDYLFTISHPCIDAVL